MLNRDELQQYIRETTEPQTAEEWTLAMMNPYSPVYKEVMHLMREGVAEEWWLERLIDCLARRDEQQRRVDQQEITDQLTYASSAEQREHVREAHPVTPEKSDLNEYAAALTAQMTGLAQAHVALLSEQQAVLQQLNQVSQQWQAQQIQQATQFVHGLANQLQPGQAERVQQAFQVASPVQVLSVNPALLNRIKPEATNTLAEDLSKRFGLVRELNVMANVVNAGEFDYKQLLQALRNKPKFDIPRCTPQDKKMCGDAITGVLRKRKVDKVLHEIEQEIQTVKKQLDHVKEQINTEAKRPRLEMDDKDQRR